MKNTWRKTLFSSLGVLALASCAASEGPSNDVVFRDADLVQSSYGGLGVEWGVYEDPTKLDDLSWARVYQNMDHLAPSRIRCMVNYDWFCENFDNHFTPAKEGDVDPDKIDDTWTYNFTNKQGQNLFDLLSYCQKHKIEVAFGAWNVIGTLKDDVWNMMDEVTGDIRWAKITADVVDYLVNTQGFTCIRYVVSGNEPNYLGVKGASKNYNNTVEKWMKGAKQVREALDKKGFNGIGIVGGDTTGLDGTTEYFTNIAKNIPDTVADYGCHLYLSNYYIDNGAVLTEINKLNEEMAKLDKGYGTTRPIDVWECGLLDGKKADTDSNTFIKTVSYGVRMADFTVQTALGGIHSVTYWDFDDGMHFMYNGGTPTPKGWGMFSSLLSDQANNQELRPWYHSSCLLTHLLKKGSKIYGNALNDSEKNPEYRVLGVVSENNDSAGYVAVNRGIDPVTKRFRILPEVKSERVYVYVFGEGKIRLGEDGFVKANYVVDGSINDYVNITVPSNSIVVASTEEL